jgi:GNAT superfamily N-acetyltransferase
MSTAVHIALITMLPGEIQALEAEAEREGFKFIKRLVSDWHSGLNRFSAPGECLIGAFKGDRRLIAVGGLNVDPYMASTDIGRLRHLYVSQIIRRQGIGAALVERLLAHAKRRFRAIRLRTDTATAAAFYIRCGLSAINDSTASHMKAI